MIYTKDGDGHNITVNHDINNHLYTLYLQIDKEAFIEEFIINDYIDHQKTPTNTSTVVRDIDGFVAKALNMISQLEEYMKTKTEQ
ncbi:unnamed protein product [Rotaria sordida]|uniref:Uncharacterized protein n=1 Tax=Rotaria sordida TaxID=392033 RepID=A0A819W3Y5_9BILA|nr:unnamed protein product [Rotaria sordida]